MGCYARARARASVPLGAMRACVRFRAMPIKGKETRSRSHRDSHKEAIPDAALRRCFARSRSRCNDMGPHVGNGRRSNGAHLPFNVGKAPDNCVPKVLSQTRQLVSRDYPPSLPPSLSLPPSVLSVSFLSRRATFPLPREESPDARISASGLEIVDAPTHDTNDSRARKRKRRWGWGRGSGSVWDFSKRKPNFNIRYFG